jgi:hypothetical protein
MKTRTSKEGRGGKENSRTEFGERKKEGQGKKIQAVFSQGKILVFSVIAQA